MTDIDGRPTRQRRSWGLRPAGNRVVYSLVIGWIFWLVAQRPSEWLILPVAAGAWLAISFVLVMIDRHRWEQDIREP